MGKTKNEKSTTQENPNKQPTLSAPLVRYLPRMKKLSMTKRNKTLVAAGAVILLIALAAAAQSGAFLCSVRGSAYVGGCGRRAGIGEAEGLCRAAVAIAACIREHDCQKQIPHGMAGFNANREKWLRHGCLARGISARERRDASPAELDRMLKDI